jgi:hypothetical protein
MGAGEWKKPVCKIIALVLTVSMVLFSASSCAPAKSFDSELERAVAPYKFNLAGWEFNTLSGDLRDAFSSNPGSDDADATTVKRYFGLCERIRQLESDVNGIRSGGKMGDAAALEDELGCLRAERLDLEKPSGRILEKQITGVLAELGIYNPTDVYLNIGITFPPVNFELTDPPYLLVVSPREKIETMRTVLLETSLSQDKREKMEAEVDKLGVSSLVVKLGGVATYPSFVSNTGDLRWVINTACEEWLHQYLTFRPLGFRYLLSLQSIARDYDIIALDETVASMTAKEIGGIVYDRYYRTPGDTTPRDNGRTGFDFNAEMRNIRENVDVLFAGGKVSVAETFMEERRQYLAAQGYYLRKLNQAYFAFYGSYTDNPTSVDPMGEQMRELRENSKSIKAFLDRASFITSREDLRENLKQLAGQAK